MSRDSNYDPVVTVVGFHHARGPEIESCFGAEDGFDPATEEDWSLLPFMALTDGAHAATEDFSYFTLRRRKTASSLFGISCTRQLDANLLIDKPADVTRSTVQKAIVVITDEPQHFGQLREKLSAVTGAWFAQRDFTDIEILKSFQESLVTNLRDEKGDKDHYFGLSLREMIHEFKFQTLVLFKCLLLQPKMLFFGSRCERLCMMQFSLISLIPGLLRSLQDCADPAYDEHEKTLVMPTSLKTSDRASLLTYMGLPLQLFGKGAFFGPYTPLQQLDLLADYGTKSYIVGSTNSLLLQQKDRYSDVLINLDETTVNITSPSLRSALTLSPADRRWIDFLTQTVVDTWDDANPAHPKNHTYAGSEEFIRLQFEEYLLALLSSSKYQTHLSTNPLPAPPPPERLNRGRSPSPAHSTLSQVTSNSTDPPPDPTPDFQPEFLTAWCQTPNYAIFTRLTSPHLFDIVVPRHPNAGGLTIEDVQRRLAQQVAELHLDERVRESREALNKHLAAGQKRLNTTINNLWADIEGMREAQRKKRDLYSSSEKENAKMTTPSLSRSATDDVTSPPHSPAQSISRSSTIQTWRERAPEIQSQAHVTAHAAQQKASAYISSWSSWATEKRKDWEAKRQASSPSATATPDVSRPGSRGDLEDKRASGGLGRWSSGLRKSEEEKRKSGDEGDRGRSSDVAREDDRVRR